MGWHWSGSVGQMLVRLCTKWAVNPDSSNSDVSSVSLFRILCCFWIALLKNDTSAAYSVREAEAAYTTWVLSRRASSIASGQALQSHVPLVASGIAGESEAQSGQAKQSHFPTAVDAHAARFPACVAQAGHRMTAMKPVTGWH